MKVLVPVDNPKGPDDLYEITDEYPMDLLITSDEWDHMRYLISQEIENCDLQGIGEFYSKHGFPFFRNFEIWIESKLREVGFKEEFIKEEIWIKGLIHTVNFQHGSSYQDYRWDINPPFGFPSGTYKVSEDGHILWFNPDIEAALRALESIRIMKGLLTTDGVINKEAVKVYLRSFELIINLSRSGLILDKVQRGVSFTKTQSKKASKERATNGLKPEDRKKRNQGIIEDYQRASGKGNLSVNGFAKKYGKKYGLKQAAIRKIIKTTLPPNRVK